MLEENLELEEYNLFDLNYDIFNDETDIFNSENTYNKLIGGGSFSQPTPPVPPVPPEPIPCFLKGTKILTNNGEKNIEDLKIGDLLISYDGRKIKLLNIYSFNCKNKNKHTLPYKIPKNTIINGKLCNANLFLSPLHEILFYKNIFTSIKNLSFNQIDKSEIDSITYYHLILPNYYTDSIFANGIICEGLGELTKTNKNFHKIIFNHIYKNNCRKLLTINEFNKFNKDNTIIPRILNLYNIKDTIKPFETKRKTLKLM